MREFDTVCSQNINEYACHHHRESAEQIAEVIRDLISQVRLVGFAEIFRLGARQRKVDYVSPCDGLDLQECLGQLLTSFRVKYSLYDAPYSSKTAVGWCLARR